MSNQVYLLFTLVTTVMAQTDNEVGPQDFTMTWIVIGVVGAVAVTLACVFGTYCIGGWCPCKKQEEKSDNLSETASLIPQPLKNPLENTLQIPKVLETPSENSTDGTETVTNSISTKPLDNAVDSSTKLENILE